MYTESTSFNFQLRIKLMQIFHNLLQAALIFVFEVKTVITRQERRYQIILFWLHEKILNL